MTLAEKVCAVADLVMRAGVDGGVPMDETTVAGLLEAARRALTRLTGLSAVQAYEMLAIAAETAAEAEKTRAAEAESRPPL